MDEIKKRYFTPSLRLKVSSDAGRALELLQSLGRAEIADGYIQVYGDVDSVTPAVSGVLAKAGIGVLEMTRQEHSLEDVYFKVMEE
jgi:hypothetical protein